MLPTKTQNQMYGTAYETHDPSPSYLLSPLSRLSRINIQSINLHYLYLPNSLST